MDVILNTNKKRSISKYKIGIAVCAIIGVILYVSFNINTSGFHVDRNTILTGKVQRGDFLVNVRGTGVLVPKDIRWIATDIEGRVEKILTKAGAKVKAGDLLIVLSNPLLTQQLEETRWELEAIEAEAQAQIVTIESGLLDQESAVLSEQLNHERTLLTLDAQEKLLSQGVVAFSKIAYAEMKIDAKQFKQRWRLEQKRLTKQKESLKAQRTAIHARVKRLQRVLERIEKQVSDLNVRATMDSIVQEMPMELGQQVNSGTNLAKLARTENYIAELRIPENLIKDVALGQKVTIDTRISKFNGKVLRIDPAVNNSSVQVDVEFTEILPSEARPDLTVDGIIEIANIKNTLFVKRPMFTTGNITQRIYLVDDDNYTATRKSIDFGRSSSRYIQINQGLKPGDEIVISDTSSWSKHQQVRLN